MFESVQMQISEIQRRIRNLVQYGVIIEVDLEQMRVRVDFGSSDSGAPSESNWIPFTSPTADTWSPPSIGEQVVVLCQNGDLEQGLVLGVVHSRTSEGSPPEAPDDKRVSNFGEVRTSKSKEGDIEIECKQLNLSAKPLNLTDGTNNLIEVLAAALEVVANSTTPTMNGPQFLTGKAEIAQYSETLKSFTQ